MPPTSAPIRYSDLVCLITGHDAEWSRCRQVNMKDAPPGSADAACERVYREVSHICGLFKRELVDQAHDAHGVPKESFPDYLFKPLGYLPIGHADVVAITLFDDVDPIHTLTAGCSTTVEEVAVGFAPRMESLGADNWPAPFEKCAVNVEEFVRQEDTLPPLLLFSRIKLGAIGLLDRGLAFQTAVLRTMMADCLEALRVLHEVGQKGGLEAFDADVNSVTSCRVTILDLQGQEEIGLLVAVDNFSIGAALLSRIQGMTLRDVEKFGGGLDKLFADDGWMHQARGLLKDMGEKLEASFEDSVMCSHALRWTRTTLAARIEAFRDPEKSTVRGFIDLVSSANIAVGHQDELDKALREIQKGLPESSDFKPQPGEFRPVLMGHADLLVQQSHPGVQPGRFIHLKTAIKNVRQLITIMTGSDQAQAANQAGDLTPRHLVGLSSWPTIPVPDLKDDEGRKGLRRELQNHYPVLQKILPVIRWRMVDTVVMKKRIEEETRDIWKLEKNEEGRKFVEGMQNLPEGRRVNQGLCPYTLLAEPKTYLAPSSLVRTAQYLFQNYNTLLSNPYVFDAVLDLHDCFATFYDIMTVHLKKVYCRKIKVGDGGPPVIQQLPTEVVAQLSRYVSALHKAMEQRLYHAFPEEPHRDMDVDFRGGLNQLISGADALVRTAMGFVKRFALPLGTFPRENEDRPKFNIFGVVNRIDFEPEIVATSLWLGTEQWARLAIIRSDVPHLCIVASYLDFIHEVGHMVFAEHRHPRIGEKGAQPGGPEAPLLPLVPIKSSTEVLLSEIYTHVLTTLLTCLDEPEVFAKHSMACYALATRPGASLTMRYQVFLLYSFQIFIARCCVRELLDAAAASPEGWIAFRPKVSHEGADEADGGETLSYKRAEESLAERVIERMCQSPKIDRLREQFRTFVDYEGSLCHEQRAYVDLDQECIYRDAAFNSHWETVSFSLPTLIGNVVDVYLRFVFRLKKIDEKSLEGRAKAVAFHLQMLSFEARVREALEKPENAGVPVVHVAEDVSVQEHYLDKELEHIESFHLSCIGLGTALRFRAKSLEMDKRVHVPVDDETCVTNFQMKDEGPDAGKGYSEYMVRARDSFLFCCQPMKRRERLRRQISLLKTFWNTASQIKARRFKALIENALSVPETGGDP